MTNKTLSQLLSEMPERFTTKEAAERRAEYLRIGTYKNAYVVKSEKTYIVYKAK